MQQLLQRIPMLAATLLVATGTALGQSKSGSLEATAFADRTDIQLGQSVIVVLEIKGSDGQPEITIPTSEDCSISLAGRVTYHPGLGGLNSKNSLVGRGNGFASQNLAESVRKLTEHLNNDTLLNPNKLKGMSDADLQKQMEAMLGNLGAPKGDAQTLGYHVHVNRSGTV